MSISTGVISSTLFCSGSSETFISNPSVLEAWKEELKRKIAHSDDTGGEFLDKYVPSTSPCTFTGAVTGNEFVDFKPVRGEQLLDTTYSSFIAGLNALLASFPAEKRVSFFDCHTTMQHFPYSAFAVDHHAHYPDIAVSFPGQILDTKTHRLGWSDFSMIIELKMEPKDDPFPDSQGFAHCQTLVQLAVDGRDLLHAHHFLASFVIGVYGDIFRILRFDHSGVVSSQGLSLRNTDDLQVLQQFFWRFVNPSEGNSVVGCDPTIRRLTLDDEKWLKDRLTLVGVGVEDLVLSEARRAEVLGENDLANDSPPAYVLFKALDVNGRLFSRATTVWLGIRDTRRLLNGCLTDVPVEGISLEDLKIRIIKDAWRQLVRRPEKDFYIRLSQIPPQEYIGLPHLICGGDLGDHEARHWELHLHGAPTTQKLNHEVRMSTPPIVAGLSSSSLPSPHSPLSATSSGTLPAHPPLQQTFTWRQAQGDENQHHERSHTRFVVDKVGRPLNKFKNTREMATAVRDAIRGHRVAMCLAGILHRDISVNNILIVDDPDDQAVFGGFIHDFDYSSMSRDPPSPSMASLSVTALTELLVGDDYGDGLKERTGTFYFMAVMLLCNSSMIHGVQHDLESFYWVLLWIVLRYTEHDHPDGREACPTVFVFGSNSSLGSKMTWLSGPPRKELSIKNNPPLTTLLREFGDLCSKGVLTGSLYYDQVLAIFDKVLDSDEYKSLWPEDDLPLEYSLPDTRVKGELSSGERSSHKPAGPSTGKRKHKAKNLRVPDPDLETDLEDESGDFVELYDDIGTDDAPVGGMPPEDEDPDNVILASDYPHRPEAQPSPSLGHVRNAPSGDVSFAEAYDAGVSEDEGDDDPNPNPVKKARKHHRMTAASGAQPGTGISNASATPGPAAGTSRRTLRKRVSQRELLSLGAGPTAVDVASWRGPARNTRAGHGSIASSSQAQPGGNVRGDPQASSAGGPSRGRVAGGRRRRGKGSRGGTRDGMNEDG